MATVASFSNQWLQIVQLLDLDGVGQLLECLGYGEYRQAFVEADIHGSELSVLESNLELSELGVAMPSLRFKSLVSQLNKVILFVSLQTIFFFFIK